MEKEKYGDDFQGHLLDQYKMYVEMADRVSERRLKTNQFYISLLSILLAILSFAVSQQVSAAFSGFLNVIFVSVSLLGMILCVLWYININSFKQLNKLKFKVVHEMEQMLPFACYDREWQVLKQLEEEDRRQSEEEKETKRAEENLKKKSPIYIRLTTIEKYIPFIILIPYLLLLIYAFVRIFQMK